MNITFLIGNGFDLNIGLATTYSAFLQEYAKPSDKDSDLLKYFKQKILKDAKMWSNAEMAFGAATEQFLADGYTAEDFCICHEDFCVKLAEYLLEQEQRLNYTALNDALVSGFVKGIQSYKSGFREAETGIITNAVNTFGGGFTFNFISFNYTAVLDLCLAAARKKAGVLGKRKMSNGSSDNQFGKVLHVHGTVHRDMVLGVNDVGQIVAPQLFEGYDEEYINELIKQKTNEINEENSDKKAFELLKNSDLIYIYGMSTGKTDKLWWDRICDLMVKKGNLHIIIHKYDAPEDGLIRRAFRLFTNAVRKDFVAYSGLDETQKEAIMARIHVDKTNVFADLCKLVESPANTPIAEEATASA